MHILRFGAIAAMASLWFGAPAPAAEFCQQTDTFDKYACLIDAAARGAVGDNMSLLPAYDAIATMQTVQTIASTARASYWSSGLTYPAMDKQELCLEEGFGICGNHQQLFIELMKRLGVPVREVGFYFYDAAGRETHAAAEFLLKGKWRYIDITWGSVWLMDRSDLGSILSTDEVRQGKGVRLTSELDPWYVAVRSAGGDPFAYLGPNVEVVTAGEGTVTVPLIDNSPEQTADFSSTPKYVGDALPDGEHRRLSLKVPLKQAALLKITVSGVAGSCGHSRIMVGSFEAPVSIGTISAPAAGAVTIQIHGDDDSCYAVLKGIVAGPLQPTSAGR
jgi:hypothetical protein